MLKELFTSLWLQYTLVSTYESWILRRDSNRTSFCSVMDLERFEKPSNESHISHHLVLFTEAFAKQPFSGFSFQKDILVELQKKVKRLKR